jgi:hypothetical protein
VAYSFSQRDYVYRVERIHEDSYKVVPSRGLDGQTCVRPLIARGRLAGVEIADWERRCVKNTMPPAQAATTATVSRLNAMSDLLKPYCPSFNEREGLIAPADIAKQT